MRLGPAGGVAAAYWCRCGEIGPLDGRSFRLTKLPLAERYQVKVWSYQILQHSGCCGVQ